MRELILLGKVFAMLDASADAGATMYELELIGDVHSRADATSAVQRRASFFVAALWPEAAAMAARQLFLDATTRLGLTVEPDVRVCRCTPTEPWPAI